MSVEQRAERLDHLLTHQDDARAERAAIVALREEILRAADEAGLTDLTPEQDAQFRELTKEIAGVDGDIARRNEEIVYLARLLEVDVEV